MSAPKVAELEARVAALEAGLARALALAEGAQRATFRVNTRLEDLGAALVRAANLSIDPYGVPEPFDDEIYEAEDGRAARIIRGETAEEGR